MRSRLFLLMGLSAALIASGVLMPSGSRGQAPASAQGTSAGHHSADADWSRGQGRGPRRGRCSGSTQAGAVRPLPQVRRVARADA